jgi:hypothetical protein
MKNAIDAVSKEMTFMLSEFTVLIILMLKLLLERA